MGMKNTSLDYELGVIGSLLIDPDSCLGDMMLELRPEDFSMPTYRHIFEAARGLWQQNKTVDAITVANSAGESYKQIIAECMMVTPTAANWRAYASGTKACTLGRKLDDLAQKLIDAETTEDKLRLVDQMQELRAQKIDAKEISWMEGFSAGYKRQSEAHRPNYLTWGIPQLDADLYIRPGSFVILGGFASAGKTAFATQLAIHFAMSGHRVGFYSYETDDETLFDRMMAQASGVSFSRIKNYASTAEDYEKLIRAATVTRDMCLTYVGASGWDVAQIRAHATARRFDVVLIDYIQLIQSKGENRAEEVARVSMALHTFAQRTGTTVVGLSQLTPTGQATPGMNDLRESRQLTQDADAILMLYRPNETGSAANDRVLHVQKNKEGRVIRTRLVLDPDTMRMIPANEVQAETDDEDDDDPRRNRHQGARSKDRRATWQ